MKREHKITFRVSAYEKKRIQAKLHSTGISLSDFCRHAVLGKEVRQVKGLDKCGYELNKIGNNLNQLTVLCHQRAVQNPNLDELRQQFGRVTACIFAALGGDDDGDCEAD